MLTIILLILAVVCFGARFFVNDGRTTAAGGILLALAVALLGQPEVLSR